MNFVRLEPRTDGDVWAMFSKKRGALKKRATRLWRTTHQLLCAICDWAPSTEHTNQWVDKGPTMHTFLFQCSWGECTYVPSVKDRIKCHCLYYTCCTQYSIIFSLNKHLAMRKASTIPLLVKYSNSFVQWRISSWIEPRGYNFHSENYPASVGC